MSYNVEKELPMLFRRTKTLKAFLLNDSKSWLLAGAISDTCMAVLQTIHAYVLFLVIKASHGQFFEKNLV